MTTALLLFSVSGATTVFFVSGHLKVRTSWLSRQAADILASAFISVMIVFPLSEWPLIV